MATPWAANPLADAAVTPVVRVTMPTAPEAAARAMPVIIRLRRRRLPVFGGAAVAGSVSARWAVVPLASIMCVSIRLVLLM